MNCTSRIKWDLEFFARINPYGISIAPDADDIKIVHALLVGPRDTPYEGGFFYFIVRYPDDYPCKPPKVTLKPPKVTLTTTGE